MSNAEEIKWQELEKVIFKHSRNGGDYLPDYMYRPACQELVNKMQAHTNQTLQELKEKVVLELTEYGIPRKFTMDDIEEVFLACDRYEIGHIKARLEFLDKIDEAINE